MSSCAVYGRVSAQRPTIAAVAPGTTTGSPGTTTSFEATASDPDGDPVTVHWVVDDRVVQTGGTTLGVDVPPDFHGSIGVAVVTVTVP